MGSRSHDFWCPKCKVHWSPFYWDECPTCGHEGIYDLNHALSTQPQESEDG